MIDAEGNMLNFLTVESQYSGTGFFGEESWSGCQLMQIHVLHNGMKRPRFFKHLYLPGPVIKKMGDVHSDSSFPLNEDYS